MCLKIQCDGYFEKFVPLVFLEREKVPVPLARHAKRARIPVASATDLRIAAWSSRRRAESNGLLRLLFYFSAQSFSL